MSKWSDNLIRTKFSDHLIAEAISNSTETVPAKTRNALLASCETRKDAKSLRKSLKSIRPIVPNDIYESLNAELDEILDDFSWSKSERGQYVVRINDWVQEFYKTMRSDPRFDNILIGGHAKMHVVFITGSISSHEHLNELMTLVNQNQPPYKTHTNVQIAG